MLAGRWRELALNPQLNEKSELIYMEDNFFFTVLAASLRHMSFIPFLRVSSAIKQNEYLQGPKKNILLVNVTLIFIIKILHFLKTGCVSDTYLILIPSLLENLTSSAALHLTSEVL